jgi:ACS family pantothenate transporter-like MFS transporter
MFVASNCHSDSIFNSSVETVSGNAYTYANTMFTAGYILGQWPSAMILASGRIRPRTWFPFCVCGWGVLTIGLACTCTSSEHVQAILLVLIAQFLIVTKTYHQVWSIRFTQGFFEASTFSGTHVGTISCGSWFVYPPTHYPVNRPLSIF